MASRSLRVLHCIYDDPRNPWVGGGGSMRVFEIYRRLAGRVDATVATGSFPGARDETVEGVRYLRLGARSPYPWSRWTYARAATELLARGGYDAAVYDFSVYTPLRLPRDRPVGVVVHMLHGPTARERWGRVLGGALDAAERRSLRRARAVSTTSRWMLEQLRPLLAPDARVELIGSGVPDEFARVERREQRYLLYYGRFDLFQKGLDTLLQAYARISREHPEVELRVAGRGKDEDRVRELAEELGVGGCVHLRPGVERAEVLELFSGALALLMPSRLEGLPMVPAEAMAAGVPVVATDVGAVAEVVDPPRGGLLVPPDDPAALADAVLGLLDHPARRAALAASARRSAERFSWDAVAERHLEFLRGIAAQDGTQPQTMQRKR
ncbi:MAG TPA: glycosyltransferase family 4 protein [Longimicrobiaceae bacterium]|nr:glycosyltransferase family 4 protein [Longimicrobiaceae bacterium]